jgi:hypothetical protein
MALPKSHLAWLRAQIKGHGTTIAELRGLRDTLAREIKAREAGEWRDPNPKPDGIPGMVAWLEYLDRQIGAHERQLELVRDSRWTDALAELLDDPKQARVAARDPRAYARKLGVNLPREVAVELRVVDDRPDLTVRVLDPVAPFEFRWTEDGFTTPAGTDAEDEQPREERRRSASSRSRKRSSSRRTG